MFVGTKKIIPYSLQKQLKNKGAVYKKGIIPFVSKTIKDGKLLTGQNPFSTRALANLLVSELKLKGLKNKF